MAAPTAPIDRYDHPDHECDLILKGGVMSGVVHPLAVCEIAKRYRYRCVGGTSSGATIASFTAAAEFARVTGRGAAGAPSGESIAPGFYGLEEFARGLENDPERLVDAFRPDAATQPIYDVLFGGQRDRALGKRPRVVTNPLFALWGKAPGALTWSVAAFLGVVSSALMFPQVDHVRRLVHEPGVWPRALGDVIALGATAAVLAAVAIGAVSSGAVYLGVQVRTRWLPALVRNGFGLAHGLASLPTDARSDRRYITAWAHETISDLAGRRARDLPLTFGELWDATSVNGDPEPIRLELMTTNLTVGRAFHLPYALDDDAPFYFDPDEWRRYFPKSVVDYMVALNPDARESHLHRLPKAADLPVLVAWRMSAALPFVLSAVPLWSVDTNAPGNPMKRRIERCWFADGGITSNFPVHFFDSLIPTRPTFAIDLRDESAEYPIDPCDQSANVWVPQTNEADRTEWWTRVDSEPATPAAALHSITTFVSMMASTAKDWRDNALAHEPGFRDRIVHVKLDSRTEGGLNLGMPAKTLRKLNARGAAAGALLREQYVRTEEQLDQLNKERAKHPPSPFWKPTTVSWQNHRWVRYRIAMSVLQKSLGGFAHAWNDCNYRDLVGRRPGAAPRSYPWTVMQRAAHPVARTTELVDLVQRWHCGEKIDFSRFVGGRPEPMPALHVTPKT